VRSYEAAVAVKPSGELTAKLHAAKTSAGRGAEADSQLQQWLKDHPDDLDALEYAAAENMKIGRSDTAITQYERILQTKPSNAMTLNNLAIAYQRQKDGRAVPTAERAYKLAPNSPLIIDTLGWILIEQGDSARGLELVQRAAASMPGNPEVRYHLAVGLAKSGDKIRARKELESLLAGHENFAQRDDAKSLLGRL
jgi:Flp pilus assembly protein TadD